MKQHPPSPKSVVGYVRVSSQEQAQTGVSLDAQEASIRRYCELRELPLAEIVRDEGVSAGIPLGKRPGGERLLRMLKDGTAGGVVAIKLDRLFRDAIDCLSVTAAWDKRGHALHLVDLQIDTRTALGRLFLTMLAAVAEMERNLIGERTSAALQHLKNEGVVLGGDRLGWERAGDRGQDGRLPLVPLEEEQATVRRIVELHEQAFSLRQIAAQLTKEGRPTKNEGSRWHASTVRSVLLRVERVAHRDTSMLRAAAPRGGSICGSRGSKIPACHEACTTP